MAPVRRRHLPSLGAFATFEVAAKHLSFTLAAKELNVTQGAVSQQIRLLETALETPLFIRKHNALDLTEAGKALFASVTVGLDAIADAVAAISGGTEPQQVTVSATDGMARFWLKPLIDSFRALHPEVGFTILASDADDTLRNYAQVDIALICGNDRCEVGEQVHFLFPELAQPVCAPAYLAAHGPFETVEVFNQINLLHLHDSHWNADAIGWQPLGWTEWFRANGGVWAKAPSSLITNKVGLLIEAALVGEGVMLGWHHMVRRHIEAGELVFAHPGTIGAGRGNFLNCRQAALRRPAVARFVAHLLAAL
ncbi:LysR substrate-binding domain-containing protein [Rhodobacter maris]|uniref:DNA-binding transcriptional LysR family regulator n=1 Tax=Rhodobacter maris TaxID=446682 RepID=A0A285T0P6_9RHOB|nr:LysR substrate-binding domain-containing protein [Rhodobacter maris]SOC14438.1 DNA-binding transcriptional LysR family regulator [Rhodobacter maris]